MISPVTGYRYRRYPESKHRNGRVYWVRTKPGGGAKYFHVDLWEHYNGPVPEGYHIHHIDHDPLNNDISNLACISPTAHAEHHMGNLPEGRLDSMRRNLDNIRSLASEWHGSAVGREWHSQNAKKMWENKQPKTLTCACCGSEFESLGARVKFCSNACKAKARRNERKDWVPVPCKGCGVERLLNRYQIREYCSKWCRKKHEAISA